MNRVHAVVVILVLSAAFAWAPRASAEPAGEACIGGPAKQVLSECPSNGPRTLTGKTPQMSFHSAPSAAGQRTQGTATKPGTPGQQVSGAQRDERRSRLHAREKALLVTEIQKLESLYSATPGNAPDRVHVVRRLAEDYVELERAAFDEKTQAEIERDAFRKAGNTQAAARTQATVNADGNIMTSARAKAESLYDVIIGQYPAYPQLDEVLYYLAYEYEQGSDNDQARKAYFKLIQTRPDSRYIPNAYLAFGELFFNEAEGDPSQWENAKQAYVKVIGYRPPENRVYGYAWYKLAYVFWNGGELDKALNAFKKTIDYGVTYADAPNAGKLAESARKDIIPVYALKGDPSAAYNFFHAISGDPSGANERTFEMMDQLGSHYVDTGHYPEAILLYKDLMVRDRSGPRVCAYQARITEATMAMRSGNKDAILVELDNQLGSYNQYESANHPADAKQECANKTAALLTETAMAWHVEAVGSSGQRGTGDPRTMKAAAALYTNVVETWKEDAYAQFQFPRIVKEDWPTLFKVKYAMADLLYFQQRWAECGPAFDRVLAEYPSAPEAPEAAYASVLCYQNLYDQIHKGGDDRRVGGVVRASRGAPSRDEDAKLAPKILTDEQKGMIASFNRYICYVHPDKTDRVGREQLVEVQYARAHTYFEARHWEEAAVLFRDIAMSHADMDVGVYAAQLYLESVNVIGSHATPPRTACFDDITADVPSFIGLYCARDRLQKNVEACTTLTRVQCDTQRLVAQKLTERADTGVPNALALYEQAALVLMSLWRTYGEAPLAQGLAAECERMDEIVYNAARNFRAARLMAKAIAARMLLVNPHNRMDKGELARKATYEIGANYQAIAVYDLAATWYERYAALRPTPPKADSALRDAVQLRLGLGQESEALEDAMAFRSRFGATKTQDTAAIQFAIGAHFASKEDWDRARGALEGAMGILHRAPPDIQIQAHATLAQAFAHTHGDESRAKAEYATVRSLWSDPDGAIAKINAAYATEDDGARTKRVAKTLNAVGEAYFFAAEDARRSIVEPLRFPEYHGPGNKADVARHIHGQVKDWYERKKAAIEQVEPDYFKILDLKPAPPPKWVIAAGARSGLMWGRFVDEFREAPIPAEWRNDPELRAIYEDGVYRASEPFKAGHAKPALKKCLDLSVAYQYFDRYTRDCEEWLGRNYKGEYHVVDELRGAPSLSNSAVGDRPPPLTLTGPIWRPPPLARQPVGT